MGGTYPPDFGDTLTLSQPGGQIITNAPPPDFQIFLRPCILCANVQGAVKGVHQHMGWGGAPFYVMIALKNVLW